MPDSLQPLQETAGGCSSRSSVLKDVGGVQHQLSAQLQRWCMFWTSQLCGQVQQAAVASPLASVCLAL